MMFHGASTASQAGLDKYYLRFASFRIARQPLTIRSMVAQRATFR
jgi:hypothetical protein